MFLRSLSHAVILGAVALGAMALPAVAQDRITIKFSHVVTADAPKGKAAEYFKRLVEERTNGRVVVEVYPNSQLYKDKEEIEALQLGAVQLLAPAYAKLGSMGLREFEVFDLPYLFDSMADAQKVTQGPIGQELLKKAESRGITGLAFWDNSFKQMTANRPLRTPEDFKGLKLRIQSSKVLDAQMRALNALPQVLAFSEVYQALQTGVVDGQENPFSNIYTQKFHEVQKALTVTNHGYHGYLLLTNKRFWDELPVELRGVLTTAIKDSTAYFNSIAKQDDDAALDAIRKSGKTDIVELTPQEKAGLKKALLPVHKMMAARVGDGLIKSIYKATGFDPSRF
ncbi:TRAP transporter substrate-binding protein [Azospirillum griseum]|uniref:DctP family TRAP transporter solute-binding subunit n=1 Tax=Azospirillum griseum TaxID=2496639 RepID=A0A431VB11_9PROT|nr:TRAP transporter substrate-binding protein [Azospirillum griseum]RTR15597.1 DctP family TRAP transporter solute-binding subunit [Azospirillum griseum]